MGLSDATADELLDELEQRGVLLVDVIYMRHGPKGLLDPASEVVHRYFSTHCRHGGEAGHRRCAATEVNGGPRQPAQCKACKAACRCPCHQVPV